MGSGRRDSVGPSLSPSPRSLLSAPRAPASDRGRQRWHQIEIVISIEPRQNVSLRRRSVAKERAVQIYLEDRLILSIV